MKKIHNLFILSILLMSAIYSPLSAKLVRAAMDVGSGQTKMVVAVVDEETGRPLKTLFAEETAILLGHDFKQSKEGCLSDKILFELEQVLINYRNIATELGAEEISGVATAVFRESKNGADFIKKIQANLGINLKLITQEQEGKLGFLTAVTASGKTSNEVISWDSGGASFQFAGEIENNLEVYQGQWGSSKVVAAMIEQVKGLDFTQTQTANPATIENVKALQEIIQKSLKPLPMTLQKKLSDPNVWVVAIGGPYSTFKMGEIATGKNVYTKEQIWKSIGELAGQSDEELTTKFPEPEMVIPRLTLIHAIMTHFGFEVVHYYETTGSTPGIFATAEFWKKSMELSGKKEL